MRHSFGGRRTEEPIVAVLAVAPQQVQFVVTHEALCQTRCQQGLHEAQHRHTLRTAVNEIADEHQPSTSGMNAFGVVTQALQQDLQRSEFTMNVADQIEWAVEKRSNQHELHLLR